MKDWPELFQESHDNWMKIPELIRQDCLNKLKSVVRVEDIPKIRAVIASGDWSGYHHFFGTEIRNALRDVLLDEELPGVLYPEIGVVMKNWDDFYLGALMDFCGEGKD